MKIAVLVFGRLNKCVEHYENIIESIGKEHSLEFYLSSDNSLDASLNEFIQTYHPIAYTNKKIQHNYNLNKYPKKYETNVPNMILHFINKCRVFQLIEYTNRNYDIILSLRIDLVFSNPIIFPNKIVQNTIYIPIEHDYGGINDRLAYGDFTTMKKYMSIIHSIYTIVRFRIVHPETLTLANLLYHKINICRFKTNTSIEY
jgi:hypothetical protein